MSRIAEGSHLNNNHTCLDADFRGQDYLFIHAIQPPPPRLTAAWPQAFEEQNNAVIIFCIGLSQAIWLSKSLS